MKTVCLCDSFSRVCDRGQVCVCVCERREIFLLLPSCLMARVIITGGCGFIGQLLARSILRRGKLLTHDRAGGESAVAVNDVILADVARPEKLLFDELSQAKILLGDVSDATYCRSLFVGAQWPVSIFHLGAVMSGQGEADFDVAMNVNLHGTMHMLEAARHCGAARPRFIMASAGATLGSGAPTDFVSKDDVVGDSTRATPHTTYGMTKACTELLLSDYSRRGFIDGRGVRLPSVIVRAGAPNAATTSCFSSVVREPLAGKDTVAPISESVRHAVTSSRTAIECILRLHDVPAAEADAVLGFDRTVFVPSAVVSLADLVSAVRAVVARESHASLGTVTYEPDQKLSDAVGSFPTKVDCSRALALGLSAEGLDAESMVRSYIEDFPAAVLPSLRLTPAAPAAGAAGEEDRVERSVVLITGGGSGIGRAVAVRLAGGGWQPECKQIALVLTGRRRELLDETATVIRQSAPGDRPQ
jgi:nucleoside-diphosphate-sugar epimerase